MVMLVTAVSDVTTVAIAPVPDPVTFSIAIFVYVPALCVADSPVVLSNNASVVLTNFPLLFPVSMSSATNINTKSALRPGIALAKIFTLFPLAYPLP